MAENKRFIRNVHVTSPIEVICKVLEEDGVVGKSHLKLSLKGTKTNV